MIRIFAVIGFVLSLSVFPVQAAVQYFPIRLRIPHIQGGHKYYVDRTDNFGFIVEILDESGVAKTESIKSGRPSVVALKDERYSIRLYNPLPVRVGVNLTVDGLNAISGKPSGISDGMKWILEPYSTVVIRGWQVNQGELRRFFFTDKPKSYAKWRSEDFNKDLSVNCGVIGAAFFWNKEELARYYENNPVYLAPLPASCQSEQESSNMGSGLWGMNKSVRKRMAADAMEPQQKAGTGMGERESHPTTLVDFHYNAGMYKLSQAIVIAYDFEKPVSPNPFPNVSYAPEMPVRW